MCLRIFGMRDFIDCRAVRRLSTLVLGSWQPNNDTVQVWRHGDLARQTGQRGHTFGEIQHAFFHAAWLAGLLDPSSIDKDMAGRASARAAAIGIDTWYTILDRTLHDGGADWHFNNMLGAGMFDICDFRHDAFCSL